MNLRFKHHLEQYEKNLPKAEDKLASLQKLLQAKIDKNHYVEMTVE